MEKESTVQAGHDDGGSTMLVIEDDFELTSSSFSSTSSSLLSIDSVDINNNKNKVPGSDGSNHDVQKCLTFGVDQILSSLRKSSSNESSMAAANNRDTDKEINVEDDHHHHHQPLLPNVTGQQSSNNNNNSIGLFTTTSEIDLANSAGKFSETSPGSMSFDDSLGMESTKHSWLVANNGTLSNHSIGQDLNKFLLQSRTINNFSFLNADPSVVAAAAPPSSTTRPPLSFFQGHENLTYLACLNELNQGYHQGFFTSSSSTTTKTATTNNPHYFNPYSVQSPLFLPAVPPTIIGNSQFLHNGIANTNGKPTKRVNHFPKSKKKVSFGSTTTTIINVEKKRSWSRTVFSLQQRGELERRFAMQPYVTKPDRRQLSALLGLTDDQVKVWFQNRRMKWRLSGEYQKLAAMHQRASSLIGMAGQHTGGGGVGGLLSIKMSPVSHRSRFNHHNGQSSSMILNNTKSTRKSLLMMMNPVLNHGHNTCSSSSNSNKSHQKDDTEKCQN